MPEKPFLRTAVQTSQVSVLVFSILFNLDWSVNSFVVALRSFKQSGQVAVVRARKVHKDFRVNSLELLLQRINARLTTTLKLELKLSDYWDNAAFDDRPRRLYWTVQLATVGRNEVELAKLVADFLSPFSTVGSVIIGDKD